ncbi:hypothetical protein [Nonomuraea aridisoli]|uniref:hypothetical protein n=1 Tax=Nonomuraea aridisoli TaxID=2070368 RepID=UPI0015E8C8B6|nr:hypothetical protein [Nonomuraea aridisoli]
MTNCKNSRNRTVGMWSGIAIGMGLGVTLDNLLLGIALSMCFGVALSSALAANHKTGEE